MLQSNALTAKGRLTLEQFDKEGNLIHTQETTNVVVDTGLAYIASRMKDASATAMSHMAVGSNSTAAASGDSALGTELGRVALTSTTVSTNSVTYVGDFPLARERVLSLKLVSLTLLPVERCCVERYFRW